MALRRSVLVLAATVAALLVPTTSAWSQSFDPDLLKGLVPKLPKGKVAKFKVTVDGDQRGLLNYRFEPPSGSCTQIFDHMVLEHWTFQRGKGYEIEIRALGKNYVVTRKGRIGDASFGAVGFLERNVTSAYQEVGPQPPCRGKVPIPKPPNCQKRFKVRINLTLSFSGDRKLELRPLANSGFGPGRPTSPAQQCKPQVGGSDPTFEYPDLMTAQSLKPLKGRKVFAKKGNLRFKLFGDEKDGVNSGIQMAPVPFVFHKAPPENEIEATVTLKRIVAKKKKRKK